MSKNVPVVRRGREVAGAGGLGKVQIIYKPKKPKPYCLMFLGFIVYSTFLGIYFTSFFWSRPQIRGNIIIPIWKQLVFGGDVLCIIGNKILRSKATNGPTPLHNNNLLASTEEDVVYQQGYVHAKERIFQMDVSRRMAMGTLTEVFGNKTLAFDAFACTWDFKNMAHLALKELANDSSLSLLEAYTKGVNDAITHEFQGMYPIDVYYTYGFFRSIRLEPWQPMHSLAILQYFAYQHNHGWEDTLIATLMGKLTTPAAIEELFGDVLDRVLPSSSLSETAKESGVNAEDRINIVELETIGSSLLAWYDQSSHTTTISTDFIGSHKNLGFWYPNYLQETIAEGSDRKGLHVQGLSYPGIPYVLAGSNADITWTFAQKPLHTNRIQQTQELITLISDEDLASGSIDMSDVFTRKEFVPLRQADEPAATAAPDSELPPALPLMELNILQSPTLGVDMYPLLSPELKSACMTHHIRHVFVQSSLLASSPSSITPAHLLRFFQRINHAKSHIQVSELLSNKKVQDSAKKISKSKKNEIQAKSSGASATAMVPWYVFVADVQGVITVFSPAANESPLHIPAKSALVAGPSAHIRQVLAQHIQNSTYAQKSHHKKDILHMLDDVFSPAGYLLAQQMQVLLQQQRLVQLSTIQSESTDKLSRYEQQRQRDFVELLSLLSTFDGRYTSESVVPSVLEAFRINVLEELLLVPLGAMARTTYGAYNVTAIARLSELEIRPHISRLLAPYVKNASNKENGNHENSADEKETSWWIERAGGIDQVIYRSLDATMDYLYKVNEQRPMSTWQWQNHHHVLVRHPVSPAVTLLDSVLGAGPELVGGNFDSVLRSDYSGSALLHTNEMLHGVDTFASSFRLVTEITSRNDDDDGVHTNKNGRKTETQMIAQVYSRDHAVRHPRAQHSFPAIVTSTGHPHSSHSSDKTAARIGDEL